MSDQRVWLTYDLGIDGDYDGLYQWLDAHQAVECGGGDSCASFTYENTGHTSIADAIKNELKKAVNLRKRDRIYIICKDKQGKFVGKFIHGTRRRPAWVGYANMGESVADEG